MKRRRPHRHFRVLRKSRRILLINNDVSPRKKRSHKHLMEKGVVNKDERKIFNLMSNPAKYEKEFGGAIDFDLDGKVEHIDIHPGKEFEVDMPADYEVQYHTHPDKHVSPPTVDDIEWLLRSKKQQAEIIFRDGRAFVIVKTPLTLALSKLPATQLRKKLDRAFSISRRSADFEKDWATHLEDLGFNVYMNKKPNTQLSVKIHPVEPKKGRLMQ